MSIRTGDKAWIVLGVGVGAYELFCPDEELMSDAADRWMLRHPWLVRAVAFLVAAHCCNALPPRFDPLHRLFGVKRFLTR